MDIKKKKSSPSKKIQRNQQLDALAEIHSPQQYGHIRETCTTVILAIETLNPMKPKKSNT